jgi:hypothetical protein
MLAVGATIASRFVARDAPNFRILYGIATMLLIALVVAAFCPGAGPFLPRRASSS